MDILSVGDSVRVKITEIDFDKKRVSLSIRALIEDGEGLVNTDEASEEAVEEATEEEAADEE